MDRRAYFLKGLDYHRLDAGPALKGETADDYVLRCYRKARGDLGSGWLTVLSRLLKDRGFEPLTESRCRTIRAELGGEK